MIGGERVLALIPARGGSKGIPRKNVKPLGGVPLIEWTIRAAQDSRYIDSVVVSTDDAEIKSVSKNAGAEVPFTRPAELSTDSATGLSDVRHALDQLPGYDLVVLLQPTSPLRSVDDVDAAIEMVHSSKCMVVSVVEAAKSPFWMFGLSSDGLLQPLMNEGLSRTNRQELPRAYVLNGAVYAANVNDFVNHESFLSPSTRALIMPAERSIDIDTELDWSLAELMAQRT